MGETCKCAVCERNNEFQKKLEELPEDKRAYFDRLYDILQNVELDNEVHECIMTGVWPSAVCQLERALERAKQHHKIYEG